MDPAKATCVRAWEADAGPGETPAAGDATPDTQDIEDAEGPSPGVDPYLALCHIQKERVAAMGLSSPRAEREVKERLQDEVLKPNPRHATFTKRKLG